MGKALVGGWCARGEETGEKDICSILTLKSFRIRLESPFYLFHIKGNPNNQMVWVSLKYCLGPKNIVRASALSTEKFLRVSHKMKSIHQLLIYYLNIFQKYICFGLLKLEIIFNSFSTLLTSPYRQKVAFPKQMCGRNGRDGSLRRSLS